jgi:hypothetical protein
VPATPRRMPGRNDYLARDTAKGSFEFSEIGINFTKGLPERLRMGVQLFAQDLGRRPSTLSANEGTRWPAIFSQDATSPRPS